jgi:DNA-binding PadR family transcriptional regulator
MEDRIVRAVRRAMVRHFLDIIVLNNIKQKGLLSGYDVVETIQAEFNFLISPGSVYSLMYCLERDGLLRRESAGEKQVFGLTDKGEEHIRTVIHSKEEILRFARTIIENNHTNILVCQ